MLLKVNLFADDSAPWSCFHDNWLYSVFAFIRFVCLPRIIASLIDDRFFFRKPIERRVNYDYVRIMSVLSAMLNVPKKWDNPGRSWNRLLRVTVRVRIMVERTMTNYLRNVWFMTRLRLLSVETEKSWDIWFIVKHLEKTFPRK